MPQSASVNPPLETPPSLGSEKSWKSPEQTDMALAAEPMGFSPKPTPPPLPQGRFGRMDLVRRRQSEYYMVPSICGFGQEDQLPLSCVYTGAICTTSSQFLGCCVPNQGDCTINTKCMNYQAWKSGKCNGSDDRTICCSDKSMPSCSVYLKPTRAPGLTVTAIDCASYSGTGTLLHYDPKWASANSFTPSPWPSISQTPTSLVDKPTGTPGNGIGGGAGVAAIAGVVVGSTAALVLIGIVAFLLLRRRNRRSPQAPLGQTGQLQDPILASPLLKGPDLHTSVHGQHESCSPVEYYQTPKQTQEQYPLHQLGVTTNVEPEMRETRLDATLPPGAHQQQQLGELPAENWRR